MLTKDIQVTTPTGIVTIKPDVFQTIVHIVELAQHGQPRSCLNCDYFMESTETCDLYKARPPARVIVNACQNWDCIPF